MARCVRAHARSETAIDLLTLRRSSTGAWTVLHAQGQVDVVTAPRLRQELVALAAAGQDRVAIDLDEVEFIDSFGLGVLVGGVKRCRAAGGAFALVCTGERVLRLLALTELDAVVPVVATVGELPASGAPAAGH